MSGGEALALWSYSFMGMRKTATRGHRQRTVGAS